MKISQSRVDCNVTTVMHLNDFYIYLSSLASANDYPFNITNSFTNTMTPAINLTGSYEMGLVSALLPSDIITISKNDPLYEIEVKINYFNSGRRIAGESVKYLPTKHIIGDHIFRVIPAFESDVRSFLIKQKILRNESDRLFFYDDSKQNVFFNKELKIENTSAVMYDQVKVTWKFSRLAASLLGLEQSREYDFEIENLDDRYRIHPSIKSSVNYIYIYSDLVIPSRVGDHQSEIIDVIPLTHSRYYRSSNNTIYKKIRKNTIENISILLTDERGRPVPFQDGASVLCVIHIKRCD